MKLRYLLVLEKNKNDYYPILWTDVPNFNDSDIFSLEAIDTWTSSYTLEELRQILFNNNILTLDELDYPFQIIYDDAKRHILPEGIVTSDEASMLNPRMIVNYLYENIGNKQGFNNLYNKLMNVREKSLAFSDFLECLRNFEKSNEEALIYLNDCSYEEIRKVGLVLSKSDIFTTKKIKKKDDL